MLNDEQEYDSNFPCFEVWYRQAASELDPSARGAKKASQIAQVKVFSVPLGCLKLQTVSNISEVFAQKMSQFIAKKNRDITTLHETIKGQKTHIEKLESQLVESKE